MKRFLLLALGLLLLAPSLGLAHGLVTTQTQTTGNYNVEFEYNTIGNVIAGDFTLFDVYLLDPKSNPIDFDTAYINISHAGGQPVLVGNLKEAADAQGSARMGGVLGSSGDYTATVQFTKDGKNIGPLIYKFTVNPGPAPAPAGKKGGDLEFYLLAGVAGLVVGLIIGVNLKLKK